VTPAVPGLADPEQLLSRLRALERLGLQGAIQVRVGAEVHVEGGFGLADERSGRRMTVDTVSDVGSISKQYTAAAIMRLVDLGLVTPEDPLDRFFDDVPADKRAITLHQVLVHSSGLRCDHFSSDFEPVEPAEATERILGSELLAPPGTRFSYSNSGYSLLGLVVERVTGEDFRAFMHRELFARAGLTRTGWYNEPHLLELPVAYGYVGDEAHGDPTRFPGPAWALLGNGGVLSTVEDMQLWVHALRTHAVLSPEATARMYVPDLIEYGYGWNVNRDAAGRAMIGHNGASIYGHSASLERYEEHEVTVAALFNTTYRGHPACRVLTDWLLGALWDDPPLAVPPARASIARETALEGRWRTAAGALLEVVPEGPERLLLGAANAEAVDLLLGAAVAPQADHETVLAVADAVLREDVDAVLAYGPPRTDAAAARHALTEAREGICGAGVAIWRTFAGGAPPARRSFPILWAPVDEQAKTWTTYVRVGLRGADNRLGCLRLLWRDGALVGLDPEPLDAPHPVALNVADAGDGTLVGLDLLSGATATLVRHGARRWQLRVGAAEHTLEPVW
jgi:CubicO group peptidase (beta-lactamase class C family)